MFSQRRKKKASTTRKANTKEVVAEVIDVGVDMDVDVVGTSTTIATTKEEKAQQKVMEEDVQTWGMKNLKFNATIVKSLGIMLGNVEL